MCEAAQRCGFEFEALDGFDFGEARDFQCGDDAIAQTARTLDEASPSWPRTLSIFQPGTMGRDGSSLPSTPVVGAETRGDLAQGCGHHREAGGDFGVRVVRERRFERGKQGIEERGAMGFRLVRGDAIERLFHDRKRPCSRVERVWRTRERGLGEVGGFRAGLVNVDVRRIAPRFWRCARSCSVAR